VDGVMGFELKGGDPGGKIIRSISVDGVMG
jgi:hypothetical protein